MSKNNFYAEILYVGLVAEKGRAFSELKKFNYRKSLRLHVALWKRILIRMQEIEYTDEDEQLFKHIIEFCKSRKEIGKYYLPKINLISENEQQIKSEIEKTSNNEEDLVILNFMNDLMSELVELLKPKIFINRKAVYFTIRALHNLPRFFLNNPCTYIFELQNVFASFQEVIEYSFGNMDLEMKNRYLKYKKLINIG